MRRRDFQFYLLLLVIAVVPIIIDAGLKIIWVDSYWNNEPLHSSMEALGAIIAFLMASLLFLTQKEETEEKKYWLSLGFISMGILDGFHAIFKPGDSFVLLHSLASLFGSFWFVLIWFPAFTENLFKKKLMLWIATLSSLLCGIWIFLLPETLPSMIHDGEFTTTAIGINILAGMMFMIATLRFILDYHHFETTENYLFSCMFLLFGVAEITFHSSAIWDNGWWLWHLLRLNAYILALLFIARQYFQIINMQKESEKKFHQFAEVSFEAIGIHKNGKLLRANDQYFKMFGYEKEELIGKQVINQTVAPESRELLRKNIASGSLQFYEAKGLRKDGSIFPIEVHAREMQYQGENARVGIIRDITELKITATEKIKTQEIISEHKKMALVGQIAGKMAHDFNNVLAVIMGNAQLALLDCKEANTIKTLELIFNQTIRGKNLTKNLIAFAKDQEPKQEFFKLIEKVELVLTLLKKDLDGIDVIKEEGHGVPDLLADPGMIEHAIVNLVQNSIHATSMVEQPKIIVRDFYQDKNIYFEIEDNGCGIPEEVLDRVYEPAFTMKGNNDITGLYKPGIKGTGYGMANVKKYIEQHKGNIAIDSKVEKGTKITINFPVIKKELTEKEIMEIKKETFYFEKYILLVEDESTISDVQYKFLTHEPCNHKVDIAATGQMAVDLFDRNKYDFVSLDYVLSGELDGMDVYKHIRQINDTIPILFVSGNLDFLESIKEIKHKDLCVDHVSKPCQNKDYVDSINKLLEQALVEQ